MPYTVLPVQGFISGGNYSLPVLALIQLLQRIYPRRFFRIFLDPLRLDYSPRFRFLGLRDSSLIPAPCTASSAPRRRLLRILRQPLMPTRPALPRHHLNQGHVHNIHRAVHTVHRESVHNIHGFNFVLVAEGGTCPPAAAPARVMPGRPTRDSNLNQIPRRINNIRSSLGTQPKELACTVLITKAQWWVCPV